MQDAPLVVINGVLAQRIRVIAPGYPFIRPLIGVIRLYSNPLDNAHP